MVAKECEYKTAASAYMGFVRIKKKMGWPADNPKNANGGKHPADNASSPKKRRVKKEKIESGDEIEDTAGDEDVPVKKRQRKNPVKKEADDDDENATAEE